MSAGAPNAANQQQQQQQQQLQQLRQEQLRTAAQPKPSAPAENAPKLPDTNSKPGDKQGKPSTGSDKTTTQGSPEALRASKATQDQPGAKPNTLKAPNVDAPKLPDTKSKPGDKTDRPSAGSDKTTTTRGSREALRAPNATQDQLGANPQNLKAPNVDAPKLPSTAGDGGDQQPGFTPVTAPGAEKTPGTELAAFQRSLIDAGLSPWIAKTTAFEDSIAGNKAFSPVVDDQGQVRGYTRRLTDTGVNHFQVIDRNGKVLKDVITGERPVTASPIQPDDLLMINPVGIVKAIGKGLVKAAGEEFVTKGAQAIGKAGAEEAVARASKPAVEAGAEAILKAGTEDAVARASKPAVEAGERTLGTVLSYGEKAEAPARATYYADAAPTPFRQKGVDMFRRAAEPEFKLVQTADGRIGVEATHTGGEWIQVKVLDAAAKPENIERNIKGNIKTAMEKFVDLLDHPDVPQNKWRAMSDGTPFRLQLTNPQRLTIHLEVPKIYFDDPARAKALINVAGQQLDLWTKWVPQGVELTVQIKPHTPL